jgi:hypothetical protein
MRNNSMSTDTDSYDLHTLIAKVDLPATKIHPNIPKGYHLDYMFDADGILYYSEDSVFAYTGAPWFHLTLEEATNGEYFELYERPPLDLSAPSLTPEPLQKDTYKARTVTEIDAETIQGIRTYEAEERKANKGTGVSIILLIVVGLFIANCKSHFSYEEQAANDQAATERFENARY